MTATRWIVRPSGFPFSVPGQPIGSILAADRRQAVELAESVFGKQVVVETDHGGSSDASLAGAETPSMRSVGVAAHAPRAMRIMSQMEIQMARAVGVVKYSGPHKGTIRRLHAESFRPVPEISDDLAKKLRAIVQSLASQLPRELMESVGGAT